MKLIARLTTITILALFSFAVQANTYDLSWMPPLERTDGTILYPSEIEGWRLSVNGIQETEGLIPITENSYTLILNEAGVYFVTVTAVDLEGRESALALFEQINIWGTQPPKPPRSLLMRRVD